MKLNYRDKILLTVVIVALVCIAGIMLFIKPAIEDVKTASESLDDAKATLVEKQALVEQDKDLDERIEEAYEEANTLAMDFYDYQQAQVATQNVDDLLDTDNLTNLDMTISSYTTVSLSPYVYADNITSTDIDVLVDSYENETNSTDEEGTADAATTASTEVVAQTIGNYTISFDFEGSLDDVKNFCEKLKSNDKKTLVLQSIDVSFGSDEDPEDTSSVKGSMTLSMIVLKKLSNPTV